MKSFRLFLNGSSDVIASLSGQAGGDPAETALLNQWAAAKQENGTAVHVRRQPGWPVAILRQQLAGVPLPQELVERKLDSEYVTAQFQSRLFGDTFDIVVLSIQPDVSGRLWRQRSSGYLLSPPPDWEQAWSPEQRQWFQANFERLDRTEVSQFREDLGQLVSVLQTEKESQVLVYGVSSYDPADNNHNYHTAEESLAMRAHRFNHALIQLSEEIGLDIVDVDRLIAEIGGRDHVRHMFHYSAEANIIIGRELFRVIEDLGYFDEHPLLKLVLPQLDLQFQSGSIVKWHLREGKQVKGGDALFDFQVEEIKRMKRLNTDSPADIQTVETASKQWSWLVRVTAADEGYFRKKMVPENQSCSVGDLLALFSVRENERLKADEVDVATAPTFRVVSNILETADPEI